MHSQQTGAANPLPHTHAGVFYHHTGKEDGVESCPLFTTLVYNVSPWGASGNAQSVSFVAVRPAF